MTTPAREKCVLGRDDRTIGSAQVKYPWCTFGFLDVDAPEGGTRCSGTVAGSLTTGITAAHCFTNEVGGGNVFMEGWVSNSVSKTEKTDHRPSIEGSLLIC